jgi:hypothetical protein
MKGSQERQVESFEPYVESTYVDVDLTGLAAFAIKRLHELKIPTTFENVVVALYRLFPGKFSLAGFDNYPDAARVGRSLLQLGPKYRNWARGSVQKGFVLTDSGAAKAAQVARALATGQAPVPSQGRARAARPRTMDLAKEMDGIEQSSLFRKWREGRLSVAEPMEFFDLLGAYAYTPTAALKGRVRLLENAAKDLGREDILEFLRLAQEQFI